VRLKSFDEFRSITIWIILRALFFCGFSSLAKSHSFSPATWQKAMDSHGRADHVHGALKLGGSESFEQMDVLQFLGGQTRGKDRNGERNEETFHRPSLSVQRS
jgi:hypothetical protein